MPNRTCSIEGCEKPAKTRGWCGKHYHRWLRYGDPHAVKKVKGDDERRFWSKVEKSADCWLWRGAADSHGYGRFHLIDYTTGAHRFAYESAVGPIPDGLQLDHLCRVPLCVNPQHLEPVLQIVNVRRGKSGDWQRSKTHCPQGHPYDAENTYVSKTGSRSCRACARDRYRKKKER